MVWGGRREEGSGWGTHVYLWRIHFDIWQNQYNIVKFKKKKKFLLDHFQPEIRVSRRPHAQESAKHCLLPFIFHVHWVQRRTEFELFSYWIGTGSSQSEQTRDVTLTNQKGRW